MEARFYKDVRVEVIDCQAETLFVFRHGLLLISCTRATYKLFRMSSEIIIAGLGFSVINGQNDLGTSQLQKFW